MAVLWCGGEDIDFRNGTLPSLNTGFGFRSTYTRCGVNCGGNNANSSRSLSFAGGAVTSCWFHAVVYNSSAQQWVGLGLNSAGQVALAIGASNTSSTKLALWKYSGGTWTQLATEAGNSLNSSGVIGIYDIQLSNFGATATVNVYLNGTQLISYSGSTAVTGVSNLDCVCLVGQGSAYYASECIVTDTDDTRAMSLLTMAPNAAGDTSGSWTGTYSNINPVTINDANVIFTNVTATDFEANLIDLPSGTFSIAAVKEIVRAEVTAGATPTGLKLGVKTGGTINVDAGRSLTASFAQYERLMAQNPVTSAAWTTSDINALQLDVQSQ